MCGDCAGSGASCLVRPFFRFRAAVVFRGCVPAPQKFFLGVYFYLSLKDGSGSLIFPRSSMLDILGQLIPFFIVALLYASVGHGGASGYLAVMALMSVEVGLIRPTALGLNVLVSAMGTIAFFRAGFFRGGLFWPLICAAVPFAYLGGGLEVEEVVFKRILGLALFVSMFRLFMPQSDEAPLRTPSRWKLLSAGAVMGFASGLIGVGGGIFLTPLVIFMRWGSAKTAAAISAPFILLNSIAGLAGLQPSPGEFHPLFLSFALAVLLGGVLGCRWGSRFANNQQIRWALGLVLSLAAFKLFIL